MTAFISYRLPAWVALTMFSLISLLSIVDGRGSTLEFEQKWSLALTSISFGIGVITCLVHAMSDPREKFVSSKMEGIVILIVVIVWVMAIPVIMAPNHGLAVVERSIVDANLYFSSWAAFASALFMFASFGRERRGDIDDSVLRWHANWWLCLFCSSMVAMVAAIRLFGDKQNCNENDIAKEQCNELRLGIALSIASAAIAAAVVILAYFLHKDLSAYAGVAAAIVVLTLWSVLVAYLTFDNGPGSQVGNLFFGTWISFVLSLYLFISHLNMAMSSSSSSSSSSDAPKKATKEDKEVKASTTNSPEQAV